MMEINVLDFLLGIIIGLVIVLLVDLWAIRVIAKIPPEVLEEIGDKFFGVKKKQ